MFHKGEILNMSFTQKNQFLIQLTGILAVPIILLSVHKFLSADESNDNAIAEKALRDYEQYIENDIVTIPVDLNEIDNSNGNLLKLEGTASYYASRFHNRLTANGERFDMNEFSAAHKTLPFGTILRVTNKNNNRSTLVRINDRGPYVGKRIIDLSKRSAQAIDGLGLPKVKLEGFIPGETIIQDNQTHYYGYYLDRAPVCISEEYVEKIDSTNRFHEAVNTSKKKKINDPDIMLMVVANEKNRRESKSSDYYYYIGKVKKQIEMTRKELLARNNQ
jgi:rare lipoprotein A